MSNVSSMSNMSKIDEAKNFLKCIGMPDKQQNDICAYTLLTLADIHQMLNGLLQQMSGYVFMMC